MTCRVPRGTIPAPQEEVHRRLPEGRALITYAVPRRTHIHEKVRRRWPLITVTSACLLASGLPSAKALEKADELPLTEAAAVRALTPEEAAREIPVKLRGVVTFFDPVRRYAFLQDETAGIFFFPGLPQLGTHLTLKAGELLEIEGYARAGGYAPVVQGKDMTEGEAPKSTLLGRPGLPKPVPLPWTAFHNDHFHNRFVETRGVVRSVRINPENDNLLLEVSTPAGSIVGVVPESDVSHQRLAVKWLDVEVRLAGVFSVQGDPQRQRSKMYLYMQSLDQVAPDFAAVSNGFAEPPRRFQSLLQFDAAGSPEKRVHVRGVVTHVESGSGVYLRSGRRGLWVQSPQDLALERGDGVAAIGFIIPQEGYVAMKDAIMRKTSGGPVPEPMTVTAAQALSGFHHADLIQIEGELFEDLHRASARALVIEADGRRFRAELSFPEGKELPRMAPGSRVRVSGLCLNFPTPAMASAGSTDFRVLLRSPADLTLLRAAPWWTPQRIATTIGGLLALVAGTVTWGLLLKRRVAQQTAVIQQKLECEVIWEERNRIARELHDTLEQQLAAITIQLESARARLPASPEGARDSLAMMQAMIQHSRGEARRSVWDLRSHTLEQRGLVVALEELAATLNTREYEKIEVRATGEVRRVDRQIEFHLLRIAQEAMTNAIKHGGASLVGVGLDYTAGAVQLVVRDNGCGFDPEKPPQGGVHFGLLGMRERAAKVNGILLVESTPGKGTTVSLAVKGGALEYAGVGQTSSQFHAPSL